MDGWAHSQLGDSIQTSHCALIAHSGLSLLQHLCTTTCLRSAVQRQEQLTERTAPGARAIGESNFKHSLMSHISMTQENTTIGSF